jgi:hypothetical protein
MLKSPLLNEKDVRDIIKSLNVNNEKDAQILLSHNPSAAAQEILEPITESFFKPPLKKTKRIIKEVHKKFKNRI